MNKVLKLVSYIVVTLILSGCTSIGSYIISNPGVYLSEGEFIDIDPEEIGFTTHEFCSSNKKQCVSYIAAPAYQAVDFVKGSSVFYNLHAVGNGVENTISHTMTPETFGRFKGTAVLLHGYGGNKEVMMASAIYFRALGMDVIIPDLFGHGDSNETFVFASQEHQILSQLIEQVVAKKESHELAIVVGHSMGTVTASNLVLFEHVDAAILLAPMMRFDLAAKEFLPYKAPMLSRIFSNNMDDIVEQALKDASVTLKETDLLINLNKSNKPILLVNSDIDSVSPPNYFHSVKNEQITTLLFENRAHSSLMVFNKDDATKIEKWLLEL